RDRHMDLGELRRDAHLLRPAPGDRTDIAVGHARGAHRRVRCFLDLLERPGQGEAEDAGGIDQPLAVFAQLEYAPAIDALALEHRAGVMERMGQNMHLGIAPRHELAVEPYRPVAIVEGFSGCGHRPRSSRIASLSARRRAAATRLA